MAHIRTKAELDARNLTPAESQLIAACQKGEHCKLGNGELPEPLKDGESPDPSRHINADVLRYLILGGCEGFLVAETGTSVSGAHVTGELDLSYSLLQGAIRFTSCRFVKEVFLQHSKCRQLVFRKSLLKGLNAAQIIVTGDVSLQETKNSATVSLSGAEIGGQLIFQKAVFEVPDGFAIFAQSVTAKGGMFFDNLISNGLVHLAGSKIGGALSLNDAQLHMQTATTSIQAHSLVVEGHAHLKRMSTNARVAMVNSAIDGVFDLTKTDFVAIEGEAFNANSARVSGNFFIDDVNFTGTVSLKQLAVGGTLSCVGTNFKAEGETALDLSNANIETVFDWRNVKIYNGTIIFNSMEMSVLRDDLTSWPLSGRSSLDGMIYQRIDNAPTDSKNRLKWLRCGSNWNGTFYPQPYTQLAKVLRDMGHDTDARKVLAERERLLVKHDCIQRRDAGGLLARPLNLWFHFWGLILRLTVGYGHRPFRSILVMIALIIFTIIPAHYAWEEGSFAPNSAVIQSSDGWKTHLTAANPAVAWSADDQAGQDWETFNRYAYGVDVVIPIINFGQTEAWAPSTTRGAWGWHLWWLRWVLSSFGWIVTALGAAAITGLIRRD